ncbi:carbon-nitrogen hydrolase family protein [Candidatus Poribacteria bacterium]|nr:carbon-nitrogen hydrolase family protein [Candidatus Poribacteria bacterium]
MTRVASVQMDVHIGENAKNTARVLEKLSVAAGEGAEVVVFPECATSGYCFDSVDAAMPYAETDDGPFVEAFADGCARAGVTGIAGFLERGHGAIHNSAALATPDGRTRVYRKTHLPTLGIDRYVEPGPSIPVYDTPVGKVGILICYDVRFPEAARALGLQGADIIAVPTNWPIGAESSPDFITRARAWESRVFVVAANRVGVERGRVFIGRSQVVAPSGSVVVEASGTDEAILYSDIDLAEARMKATVHEPGEWELDLTTDRRPELYGVLTDQG